MQILRLQRGERIGRVADAIRLVPYVNYRIRDTERVWNCQCRIAGARALYFSFCPRQALFCCSAAIKSVNIIDLKSRP